MRAWTLTALTAALVIFGVVLVTGPSALAQSRAAADAPIRLYVFDGGILESDPARYQLTKEDVGETRLSIAAYLIVHPKGLLMWDAAAVTDAEWTPTGSPVRQRVALGDGQERFVTLTRPLAAQLQAAGYKPSDITHLALSHYHWDHTANANLFASATWLVRKEERDAMLAAKPGASRSQSYSALAKSRTQIVTADEHDVFGDGTVILKAAAGHTPGHQVLYVKLPETGPVVLSGDLYHYPQERSMARYPTFEFNLDQTRASRASLEAFMTRTKARLWIQHDLTAHAALKKAPEYYK
jgi:glyoxylase-like metal-dependent hydrolase (beta-lactamase superfamily II)